MALGAELEGDARGWSSRSALGGRAQGWQHVGAELWAKLEGGARGRSSEVACSRVEFRATRYGGLRSESCWKKHSHRVPKAISRRPSLHIGKKRNVEGGTHLYRGLKNRGSLAVSPFLAQKISSSSFSHTVATLLSAPPSSAPHQEPARFPWQDRRWNIRRTTTQPRAPTPPPWVWTHTSWPCSSSSSRRAARWLRCSSSTAHGPSPSP
jgi:hypothetical protein